MGKKWMILLSLFSCVTLITSITSMFIILNGDNARTEVNSNKVIASNDIYKSVSIVYETDNTFNISNLNPGDQITKTFTITNNNSDSIFYNIEWRNINSTWQNPSMYSEPHPEEFIYTLQCTNGEKIESAIMPTNNNDPIILENLEIKSNKKNTCNLTMKFNTTGYDQSYNLYKTFEGTIKVIIKE